MTGRAVLRAGLVLLGVAALGWGAASAATTLSSETRVVNQRHTDIRTVEVHAGMGVVGVTGRPGATEVLLRQRQRWRLRTPRFSSRRVGDRLVVRSSCSWNIGWPCDGALDLTVPPGISVDVRSGDGEVFFQGLTGSVTVRGGDGPITGTALRGADIDVRAGDGPVDVSFIVAPRRIRVAAADGPVEIRLPRDGRPWRVVGDTDAAARARWRSRWTRRRTGPSRPTPWTARCASPTGAEARLTARCAVPARPARAHRPCGTAPPPRVRPRDPAGGR